MKKVFYLSFLILFCMKIHAQQGQTYSFNLQNPIDLKKINIVGADNFDLVYVNLSDLTFNDAPFIAASVRLEGQQLDDNLVINVNATDRNLNRVNYLNLHHFHESDADPTQIFVSELGYLDKTVNHIQFVFRMEKTVFQNLNVIQIRLFNPTNIPINKTTSLTPEGACDLPPLVSRSVWGANLGLQNGTIYKGTATYTSVTHLIVHHSAGPNSSSNWAATVASIFDFHVNSNGWSDVGYNYLIAPDGTLFYGRGGGLNVIGAHYCAKNGNTMGVCMMGNYMTVAPTDTAWRTLEKLLAWKAVESNINPTNYAPLSDLGSIPVVNGHRSGCATDCPGDSSFNRLPALRNRLGAMVAACRTVASTDLTDLGRVTLTPNPVSQGQLQLNLEINSLQNIDIQAFDALGRQVFEHSLSGQNGQSETTLEVSTLPKGVYFFKINIGTAFQVKKVVVE